MHSRTLPTLQNIETMGRLSCFKDVSLASLKQLANDIRHVSLKRQEILFAKNDPAHSLYILVSGQIKLFLTLSNGVDKTLDLVPSGQPLCVAPIWQGEPYPVGARADMDSHLLTLSRAAVVEVARQDAALAGHLLDATSHQLLNLIGDMENCAQRSSLQRVTCFLLQQRPDPEIRAYEIVLRSSKRDIATRLSLAQETLSRVFQKLGQNGVIRVAGRNIHVLDSHKLLAYNMANCGPVL